MPAEMPAEMPPSESSGMRAEKPMGPKGEPLVEVTLCVYPGGKLALKLDDGEKHAVRDLDTAMAAIRRIAQAETQEPGAQAEGAEAPAEESEEQAMMSGYGG